ncbi:hypothetical protein [Streptomyces sp. HPF1205]|uniref:hypothetical protein n=1 Tax=Streptomyces sp. HPF1205 TaxID=2873262 RepID=UPI001CEC8937|nr:hypothetical protein [Streptomyces sp. HPF1205]
MTQSEARTQDRTAQEHIAQEQADGRREPPPADCVLCGEPTEYPASTRGATLCPVCEWQEAQRTACSG